MLSSPNYLHRICHGMVKVSGMSKPDFAEIWQTGKDTYELRIKIPKSAKTYTDIHYVNVTGNEGIYIYVVHLCVHQLLTPICMKYNKC